MSPGSTPSDDTLPSDRSCRIQMVVDECLRRRADGEAVAIDDLLGRHGDLMPELGDALRKLDRIRRARAIAEDHGTHPSGGSSGRAGRLSDDPLRDVDTIPSDALQPLAAAAGSGELFILPDAIPGYQLVREIRRGGQGVIYQAIQQSTRRKVAIKVMKEGPFLSPRDRARFQREVQILGQLSHPNIVAIHDSGMAGGSFFYVMDYVTGYRLDEYLERSAGRSKAQINDLLKLFVKICEAIHAAHRIGIIHRDLKPGNIIVDAHDEPQVLDFGLAKTLMADTTDETEPQMMTLTGQFLGSLPWASPEQAEGIPSKVDVRTDVYALGVILYQMLTGKFPYEVVGNMRDVLDRIIKAEPARPSTIRRQINDEVETIVLKCLAKERERRYQTAGDLARDIKHYLAGEPIEAKRDSALYVLRKRIRRHRAMIGMSLVILAVVSTAVAVVVSQRSESSMLRALLESRSAAEEMRSATSGLAVADRTTLTPADPDTIQREAAIAINCMREPRQLNPLAMQNEGELLVCDLLFDRLFDRTRELELTPNARLIHAIDEDPADPRIKTIRLKPNLHWHDGVALTAEDVVFTWQQTVSEAVRSNKRQSAQRVERAEALDPLTVQFTLREPHPSWRASVNVDLAPKHLFAVEAEDDPTLRTSAYYRGLHRKPVGCGPFELVSWDDDRITLKRWAFYPGDEARFERVIVRWLHEPSRILDEFLAGGLDLCTLTDEQFDQHVFTEQFRALGEHARYPDTTFNYVLWNCSQQSWFADAAVRQAMAHAIDIERVKAQVMNNLAAACYGPWPVESPYFNPQVKRFRFNLERAAELLDAAGIVVGEVGVRYGVIPDKESGVRRPFEFTVLTPTANPRAMATLQIVKGDLERIGVGMEIEELPWADLQARLRSREFDAAIGGLQPPTEIDLMRACFVTGGKQNLGDFTHAEVDKLFEDAGRELEPDTRREMYRRLHEIIFDEQPWAFLYHKPSLWAVSRRLRGVEFSLRGPYLFAPGVRNWWVDRAVDAAER